MVAVGWGLGDGESCGMSVMTGCGRWASVGRASVGAVVPKLGVRRPPPLQSGGEWVRVLHIIFCIRGARTWFGSTGAYWRALRKSIEFGQRDPRQSAVPAGERPLLANSEQFLRQMRC